MLIADLKATYQKQLDSALDKFAALPADCQHGQRLKAGREVERLRAQLETVANVALQRQAAGTHLDPIRWNPATGRCVRCNSRVLVKNGGATCWCPGCGEWDES